MEIAARVVQPLAPQRALKTEHFVLVAKDPVCPRVLVRGKGKAKQMSLNGQGPRITSSLPWR